MLVANLGPRRKSSLNPHGTIRAYITEIEQCAEKLVALRQRKAAVTSEIDAAIAAIQSLRGEQTPSVPRENMAMIDGMKKDISNLEDYRRELSVAIDEAKTALNKCFVQ